MRLNRSAALALLPALLIAACGDDPTPAGEAEDTGTAAGDVLGGSISDDMLPLTELESQSPPLREAASNSNRSSSASSAAPNEPAEATPPAETDDAASSDEGEQSGEGSAEDAGEG